ncbi:MAG: FadR family transcriptional regulator [Alteromonadaceae bacterium]|nr:FadR family transcriptional regulator [Alteromonadaceae bacterium]
MSYHSPQNLTYQLTSSIGLDIIKGKYKTGEVLPTEIALSTKLQVSRSALREAIKMLSAKGLIQSIRKKGIVVLPKSNWNMFDEDVLRWILSSNPTISLLKSFTEVRMAIEIQAATLACVNATTTDLEKIELALDRMKAAEKGLDDHLESDIAFHTSILEASGNPFLSRLTGFTSTALKVSIRYTNAAQGKSGDIAMHDRIYEHIKSKDAEKAQIAVKELLSNVFELIDSYGNDFL